MLYNYDKSYCERVSLTLADGKKIVGELIEDMRISVDTLPNGKTWYQIRHSDLSMTKPASLKHGCVVVNFFGTFVCGLINDFPQGAEIEIKKMTRL